MRTLPDIGDIAGCVALAHEVLRLLPHTETIARTIAMLPVARAFRVSGDVRDDAERRAIAVIEPFKAANNLLGRLAVDAKDVALGYLTLARLQHARDADARHFFEESLVLYQALERRWEASQVLLWLGDLARYQGDFREARGHFQASLAIRSALGDRRGVAEVLIWDSHAAAELGQVDEAEMLARRSYALHAELGDPANRVFGLGELGNILMWAGKYEEAADVLRQSLEFYQDLGNRATSVYAQGWLAIAYLGIGKYEAARKLSQQAIVHARELPGATSGLAFVLHYGGWVALTLGAYHEAGALLEESVALHRRSGNAGHVGWPLAQLGYAHWLLGDRPHAEAELLEVIEASARQHAFTPLLLALPAIALVLAERGHAERAIELYALAWRHPLLANARGFIDSFGQRLDCVVSALPPDLSAAAQARGQALNLWETAAVLHAELWALGWGQNG